MGSISKCNTCGEELNSAPSMSRAQFCPFCGFSSKYEPTDSIAGLSRAAKSLRYQRDHYFEEKKALDEERDGLAKIVRQLKSDLEVARQAAEWDRYRAIKMARDLDVLSKDHSELEQDRDEIKEDRDKWRDKYNQCRRREHDWRSSSTLLGREAIKKTEELKSASACIGMMSWMLKAITDKAQQLQAEKDALVTANKVLLDVIKKQGGVQ